MARRAIIELLTRERPKEELLKKIPVSYIMQVNQDTVLVASRRKAYI
jgi:hypothetical protein